MTTTPSAAVRLMPVRTSVATARRPTWTLRVPVYLLAMFPPSVFAGVVLAAVVLVSVTWLFGWLALRLAVSAWRSGRGTWWLRLSANGFQVNDRVLRPRRYKWRDIDAFMLVAPAGDFDCGALSVGYRLTRSRPSVARRMFVNFRDRNAVLADGLVMGFWDRPFGDAVALLNDSLRRHCPAKEAEAL